MKGLLLFNVFSIVCLLTQAQVTNSFPDIGIPTVGGSNYMSISNRLFFQAKNQTENGNNRGIVANNLYWDSAQAKWSNGTVSSFDFAMMRFEAGGVIGFFNGPVPDPNARQAFTNSELEAYRTLTIKSTGRVGIGTANPATYFSVTESTSSGNYGGYPAIEINNPNTSGGAVAAFVLRSGSVSAAGLSGAIGALQCNSTDNASQSTWLRSYTAAYPIYIGYAKTDLTVNNGKIGIGTSSPVEKLSVEGTILAQKVRVSQVAADWPDFVFDSSYYLMPLDELESFIKNNHHLPQIAPAADMQKNGVDLGDNQTKLLQKTEELTLYLIEQNKQLKEQLAINTAQNKKIQELTGQVSEIAVLKQLIAKQQEAIAALQQKASKTPNDNKD